MIENRIFSYTLDLCEVLHIIFFIERLSIIFDIPMSDGPNKINFEIHIKG